MGATAGIGHHWGVLRDAWTTESARRAAAPKWRETDFLPAALEIVETPPNPLGRWLLWSMMGCVGAALAWSLIARVDVVAVAPAKVIATDHNKLLQATDVGVVRRIFVRDGQSVKRGQPLVTLDPTETGAEKAQAEAALTTARVDAARERAVIAGLTGGSPRFIAPPGTAPEVVATQRALIASRLTEYASQQANLRAQGQEAAAQRGAASAQIARLSETMPYLQERIAKRRILVDKGFGSRLLQPELEEQKVDREHQASVEAQNAARADATLAGVRQQIAAARQTMLKDAYAALGKAEAEVRQREEELTKATGRSGLRVLRAPVDGTVQQLAVYTEGAVMKAADPILVIVPSGGPLVVEAKVLNRDEGFVSVGQPVTVKLEAFPFTRYGTIKGRLAWISRDAVEDEKLGPVYAARIALSCLPGGPALCAEVDPGLTASAEIRTGERRVIDFLLSPLERRVAEAGRER